MYGVTTHSANIGTLIMDNHTAVTSYFVFNNLYVYLYMYRLLVTNMEYCCFVSKKCACNEHTVLTKLILFRGNERW